MMDYGRIIITTIMIKTKDNAFTRISSNLFGCLSLPQITIRMATALSALSNLPNSFPGSLVNLITQTSRSGELNTPTALLSS